MLCRSRTQKPGPAFRRNASGRWARCGSSLWHGGREHRGTMLWVPNLFNRRQQELSAFDRPIFGSSSGNFSRALPLAPCLLHKRPVTAKVVIRKPDATMHLVASVLP